MEILSWVAYGVVGVLAYIFMARLTYTLLRATLYVGAADKGNAAGCAVFWPLALIMLLLFGVVVSLYKVLRWMILRVLFPIGDYLGGVISRFFNWIFTEPK